MATAVEPGVDLNSPTLAADAAQLHHDCLVAYRKMGQLYATLCGRELEIERDKSGQKLDAIRRIMSEPNGLTGNKHSASSAEQIAETDHQYRAFLTEKAEVVAMKNNAYVARQAAWAQAELALAIYRAKAGLR